MPFEKGQSGNPGGRRKQDFSIVELARSHSRAAIETLANVMVSESAADSARVSAANSILDRGFGKPPQAVSHSGAIGTFDASKLTDDELAVLEPILARLAGVGVAGGDGTDSEASG